VIGNQVMLPKIKKQDLLNSDTTLEGANRKKEIRLIEFFTLVMLFTFS
jgi:hypothetical protein